MEPDGKEQPEGVLEMPERQPNRHYRQDDVEDTPVANDVAICAFALHRTLDILYFLHLVLHPWQECAWLGKCAFAIRDEAILSAITRYFLGQLICRDVGQIP